MPGYPDYQRWSNSGGFQVYAAVGAPAVNTILFEGFVGLWPYVNLFLSCLGTADFCEIELIWCSDSTFANQVASTIIVRGGQFFSATQYSCLTSWLVIQYQSKSGSNFPFNVFEVYASNGYARQGQLASTIEPIFSQQVSVPATSNFTAQCPKVVPGIAYLFSWFTGATWSIDLNYYDYVTGTWIPQCTMKSGLTPNAQPLAIPMMDTVYELSMNNGDASAQQFWTTWTSAAGLRDRIMDMTPSEIAAAISAVGVIVSLCVALLAAGIRVGRIETEMSYIRRDLSEIRALFSLTLANQLPPKQGS